jgi:hypothetical protein
MTVDMKHFFNLFSVDFQFILFAKYIALHAELVL